MSPASSRKSRETPINRPDTGALGRGLAIVDVLVGAMRPLTLHEIAEAVKLTDSTVHRILQALCEANHVLRDPTGKRYHASSKALSPLTMYHPLQILRRDAMEPLRQLRVKTDLTSSLVVFVGMERLVLDISGAPGVLTPYFGTCLTNPLHVAVSGKLMLIGMTPSERHELLGTGPYEALTLNTITDPLMFEKELERGIELGYSTNLGENFIGLSAIGAALVCEAGQVIGCIMLAGSSREFTQERIVEWGRALKDLADLISFSQGARTTQSLFS
jgi:DNA-binding IclR family transcriptional regulator